MTPERDIEQEATILGLVLGMMKKMGLSAKDAKRIFSRSNIDQGWLLIEKKEATR